MNSIISAIGALMSLFWVLVLGIAGVAYQIALLVLAWHFWFH